MKKKQPIKPVLKEKGFWETSGLLDDKESPAAKYFDLPKGVSPTSPPAELKNPTKPFNVDFSINADNSLNFHFSFHGFKE
jgi:hypothetical protein